MKTLNDVVAGDEIVMINRTGRLTNGKRDDRIVRAVVTEAKRVNLTIEAIGEASGWKHTWTIRRDTRQESRSDAGMYGWAAFTVDEHERNERKRNAYNFLHEQGIQLASYGSRPWLGREIELANIIRKAIES